VTPYLVALKWLEDHAPVGILNAQTYTQGQFPEEDAIGTLMMTEIASGLGGVRRHGGWRGKVMITSQTAQALHGPDESPGQLYEQLCEAFRCTPLLTQKPTRI
jgi:hypothetical protein